MDFSDLPEPMRNRIAERSARPPLDKVRDMLQTYVEDAEDLDEVRRELRDTTNFSTFYLHQYLAAFETILSEPQPPGTLLRLVAWDANWGMGENATDEAAAVFLREIAEMIRDAIRESDRR
ncbi:hypothetical protein KZ829_36920 [Actinoplanes hulinensis]|uniref:Uncharacterized protein n=1 Tax=Actinoplanes hulinensis TaxID=1144547 RepID=A0ABS7BEL7_9ACTN|nr:hypothetical protein [Actinoplanes hulinensis]MBW6439321.1 hypothetical protein [Actinoplanes hulinensis]